jgi:hypothetical protein
MKRVFLVMLTTGIWLMAPASGRGFQQPLPSQEQPCKTNEGIAVSIKQDLADTVNAIKKESLDDFEKKFHQQACLSKLSICLDTVQELLSCLDKAAHDPATSKADAAACKAKTAAYGKLKTTLEQDLAELKAAKDPKTAKDDIEKFDFSN